MAKKKDLMKATQNTMDKFFTEAKEEPAREPEKPRKAGKKTDTHKPFSFWAVKAEADEWRLWAKAKGMKVDDLGAEAIREYIRRHKLSDDQQQIYDLMKKS